jgi:hypothetical protein
LDVLAVGLGRFEPVVDAELSTVGDGGAVFKAVRGEYGAGKTFFTRWLAERAKRRGLAASEVQVSETQTPLHRLETVYRRVVENLATEEFALSALRPLLNAWMFALEEDVLAGGAVAEDDAAGLDRAVGDLLERRLGEIARTAPGFAAALRGLRVCPATPRDAMPAAEQAGLDLLGRPGWSRSAPPTCAGWPGRGWAGDGRTALTAAGAGPVRTGDVAAVFCKPGRCGEGGRVPRRAVRGAGHPADHARLGLAEQRLDELTPVEPGHRPAATAGPTQHANAAITVHAPHHEPCWSGTELSSGDNPLSNRGRRLHRVRFSQQGFVVGQDPWGLTWGNPPLPCRRAAHQNPLNFSADSFGHRGRSTAARRARSARRSRYGHLLSRHAVGISACRGNRCKKVIILGAARRSGRTSGHQGS